MVYQLISIVLLFLHTFDIRKALFESYGNDYMNTLQIFSKSNLNTMTSAHAEVFRQHHCLFVKINFGEKKNIPKVYYFYSKHSRSEVHVNISSKDASVKTDIFSLI